MVVPDGTTHLVLSPSELIEKLAALIPPPRLNLVRYHGVFAPNAADRGEIVPGPEPAGEGEEGGVDPESGVTSPRRPCRLMWAQLLARVFEHATDCTSPNRGDRRSGSHHSSLSSAVRTSARRHRLPPPMG